MIQFFKTLSAVNLSMGYNIDTDTCVFVCKLVQYAPILPPICIKNLRHKTL
jgi:hypothetical protein